MFGCLISGFPVNVNCQRVEEGKFLFPDLTIRSTTQHLALFLVPGQVLPPGLIASIFLRFHADPSGEWRHLGALAAGKESAIFRIALPPALVAETLAVSVGISLLPATAMEAQLALAPRSTVPANPSQYALIVAKKLLANFVNYALSFSRTFVETGGESFVPAKVITDWFAGTERKVQADPEGFLKQLLRTSGANE